MKLHFTIYIALLSRSIFAYADNDNDSMSSSSPSTTTSNSYVGDNTSDSSSNADSFSACISLASKFSFECSESNENSRRDNDSNGNEKSNGDKNGKDNSNISVTSCNCLSPEYLATVVDCIDQAASIQSQSSTDNDISSLVSSCSNNNVSISSDSLQSTYNNATSYFINSTSISDATNVIYNPIRFSDNEITDALSTLSNSGNGFQYRGGFFGYVLILIF